MTPWAYFRPMRLPECLGDCLQEYPWDYACCNSNNYGTVDVYISGCRGDAYQAGYGNSWWNGIWNVVSTFQCRDRKVYKRGKIRKIVVKIEKGCPGLQHVILIMEQSLVEILFLQIQEQTLHIIRLSSLLEDQYYFWGDIVSYHDGLLLIGGGHRGANGMHITGRTNQIKRLRAEDRR